LKFRTEFVGKSKADFIRNTPTRLDLPKKITELHRARPIRIIFLSSQNSIRFAVDVITSGDEEVRGRAPIGRFRAHSKRDVNLRVTDRSDLTVTIPHSQVGSLCITFCEVLFNIPLSISVVPGEGSVRATDIISYPWTCETN